MFIKSPAKLRLIIQTQHCSLQHIAHVDDPVASCCKMLDATGWPNVCNVLCYVEYVSY